MERRRLGMKFYKYDSYLGFHVKFRQYIFGINYNKIYCFVSSEKISDVFYWHINGVGVKYYFTKARFLIWLHNFKRRYFK